MDFEERIGHALNEAGQSYDLQPQALLDRGLRRGLALRRRRVAYRVTGAALALALVGTGPAALSPGSLFGRNDQTASSTETGKAKPSASTTAKPSTSMSGDDILNLMESLLPPGKVGQAEATGAGGGRPYGEIPRGQFLYDDGHGAALFQFGSAVTGNPDVLAPGNCTSATTKYGTCEQTELADGSTVSFRTSDWDKKSGLAAALDWTATIVTRSGDRLWLDESNSPTGSFTGGTRLEPPLDRTQLTAIVKDPRWAHLFTAIHAAKPDHQLTGAQVLATARRLLPAGVDYRSSTGSSQEGTAGMMVGTQQDVISITVQRWPVEARDEIVGSNYKGATRLPDGTLLVVMPTVSGKPPTALSEKQAWTVRVLRPDGTSIALMEETVGGPTASTSPALTIEQLKAIAMSPGWIK